MISCFINDHYLENKKLLTSIRPHENYSLKKAHVIGIIFSKMNHEDFRPGQGFKILRISKMETGVIERGTYLYNYKFIEV